MLYAVSGMKHKEIAESLGLSCPYSVKYHRALKNLESTWKEGSGHEGKADIRQHKRSVDQAPIDLLDKIKAAKGKDAKA